MTRTFIDIAVVLMVFSCGMSWTVFRYGKQDRLAFAVIAILSPLLAVISVFRLLFLVLTGKVTVGPCPVGLSDAEQMVEIERQRMFGGEIRKPTLAINWQRAYELELQHEAEKVQRFAHRIFVIA